MAFHCFACLKTEVFKLVVSDRSVCVYSCSEGSNGLYVEGSDGSLLHPSGWGRFSAMKASRIVTSINKPLATKEASVVNVCPEALAPGPAFRFSFCLLSKLLCRHVNGPSQVRFLLERLQSFVQPVSPPMRFSKHGSESWNEISLLSLPDHKIKEGKPHLSLCKWIAAFTPVAFSQQRHV